LPKMNDDSAVLGLKRSVSSVERIRFIPDEKVTVFLPSDHLASVTEKNVIGWVNGTFGRIRKVVKGSIEGVRHVTLQFFNQKDAYKAVKYFDGLKMFDNRPVLKCTPDVKCIVDNGGNDFVPGSKRSRVAVDEQPLVTQEVVLSVGRGARTWFTGTSAQDQEQEQKGEEKQGPDEGSHHSDSDGDRERGPSRRVLTGMSRRRGRSDSAERTYQEDFSAPISRRDDGYRTIRKLWEEDYRSARGATRSDGYRVRDEGYRAVQKTRDEGYWDTGGGGGYRATRDSRNDGFRGRDVSSQEDSKVSRITSSELPRGNYVSSQVYSASKNIDDGANGFDTTATSLLDSISKPLTGAR
jgi:hypothetical protein